MTVTAVPAGMHAGAVHITSLVVSALDGSPRAPALAVHENSSTGVSSSRATT
ncbi:hypothetical protein [Stigmatella hybrida]|uniref:hypothetical protein n=1 Tax=Stigmatella hybrida TaxID=394097 RepID=UPI001CDA8C0D|nr:hypothetical protein [Stigmatella hybrida]